MPLIRHLLSNVVSRSDPVIKLPESTSPFTLDSSGVAGFFGGDGAVAAMATVHLLPFRAWGGWYNSPGSYEIAKRYGQLANSPFWDGLFPGNNSDPAEFFELDGKVGPRRFLGVHSGTNLSPTGHLAYLLARRIQAIKSIDLARYAIPSSPIYVTVVRLDDKDIPPYEIKPPTGIAAHALQYSGFLAILPIAASIAACILCALVEDWYCFACIAFGILAGGVACAIIGSGELVFRHPRSAKSAPPGDGILWGDKEVIVLLGSEDAVNVFTRGSFSLRFGTNSEPVNNSIGWCSVFLTLQFLVQLLLIPQGTLFGQIMFVASLGVSWMYNIYVSSFDNEALQMGLVLHLMPQLAKDIKQGRVERYRLPSWRTAVVLSMLLMHDNHPGGIPNPFKPLDELLPNDTPVWCEWKKTVIESFLSARSEGQNLGDLGLREQPLFRELFADAEIIHREYQDAVRR